MRLEKARLMLDREGLIRNREEQLRQTNDQKYKVEELRT